MTDAGEQLRNAAIASGAAKAVIVPVSSIVLSDSFRKICESNSCGAYNRCYMCPPDCGDIHEMMEQVQSFKSGMLYQYVATIEDSFDIEGMMAGKKAFVAVSQRVNEKVKSILPANFMHLAAGGCGLCEKCAKTDDLPCRFPDKALPSMESAGIDVYHTSKNAGLKYINGENTVTYFGIVLYGE